MSDTEARALIHPQDEHNRELVANVHPGDWANPEPADRYHLVVVGAGTAGLVTAAGAAGLGAGSRRPPRPAVRASHGLRGPAGRTSPGRR